MAKKDWSISLKKEFYKDIFGIILFPLMLTVFATIIFFIYLFPTVDTIKKGGEINYKDEVADFYRTTEYTEAFGTSSATEDNLLIVFLTSEDEGRYYCVTKVGTNINAKTSAVFGNADSEFGKIVTTTIVPNEDYVSTLGTKLESIMDATGDKIVSLDQQSPFKADSDRSNLAKSSVENKTSLVIDEASFNDTLAEFTDKTGISVKIVIDDEEAVFGRRTPTGTIIFLCILVGVDILCIFSTTKKVIARIRFEKNPQLFYKPTIYDANDTDENL
ncbi:MAG: hypothetical protein IJW19_03385 [Clostridia bacterium]|nr:hypothetical protein [Clostridia bacterium]